MGIQINWSSCLLLATCLVVWSTTLAADQAAAAAAAARRVLKDGGEAAQQFLEPHNRLRSSLGLPLLRWNSTVAAYAAWWAGRRKGDCQLTHSDGDYGENIFWGEGSSWRPANATAEWAAERMYYHYASNSCDAQRDCTHYTQMVWRRSTQLGCAWVVCRSGDTFITCNYYPHGNVLGQKPY